MKDLPYEVVFLIPDPDRSIEAGGSHKLHCGAAGQTCQAVCMVIVWGMVIAI